MSPTPPTIRGVRARAVDVPISRPVKNAFGVIRSAPLVLIDVMTDQGLTGRSYIFGYAKTDA
jgi:mandelate racemase